ncbi:hypothetical protein YPPY14_0632, partial [Yersinia pestis PY-14]
MRWLSLFTPATYLLLTLK